MQRSNSLNTYFYIKLGLLVLLLVILDFLIQTHFNASINSKIIFGTLGSNFLAELISVIAAVVICFVWFIRPGTSTVVLLAVLAGLLANLIERLLLGGVIDYLKISFIPTFNLSDILIVIGCIFFAYAIIKKESVG